MITLIFVIILVTILLLIVLIIKERKIPLEMRIRDRINPLPIFIITAIVYDILGLIAIIIYYLLFLFYLQVLGPLILFIIIGIICGAIGYKRDEPRNIAKLGLVFGIILLISIVGPIWVLYQVV